MCCATIVRIENAGPGLRARRLIFDDDSPSRTTSAAAVKHLALAEGMTVRVDELERSLAEVEYPLAKDRALMLLGYREHSAAELRRKLIDVGYPQNVCQAVVARFEEIELVDDARFAGAWARSRRIAGYGSRRIVSELELRGVDEETISAALSQESDESEEIARARAALRGKTAEDRAGRERLLRRLVARGFSLAVALKATGSDAVDGSE